MKEKIDFITKNLRQQAEEILKHKVYNQVGTLSEADSLKLMHEMEVYQIELDMQNDELQRTKAVDAKRMKLVHELNVHKLELEMQNDEIERARMAAEEIAKKYSILYDFAPTGYFTLSDVGDILGLNLSGAQMLNKERSKLINCRFGFFVSNNTKPFFQLFLDKVFITEKTENCEIIITIDGQTPKFIHLTGIIDTDKQCLVTAVDITKRKKAEDELLLKNVVFDTSIAANCIANLDGTITEVNHSFYLTYGYRNKYDVIGKHFSDFTFFEPDGQAILKSIEKTSQWEGEFVAKNAKGNTFYAQGTATVLRDKYGEIIGFQSSIIDVTTQKQAEEALHASEQKFRSIFENTQDVFFRIDLSGNIIDISPSIELFTKISRKNYIGTSILHSHDGAQKAQMLFNSILNNKSLTDFEIKIPVSDGDIKYVSVNAKLIFDCNGKPIHIDGSMRDVTHRKQTEENLKSSQLLLNSSIESPKDMIILSIDKEYNYLYFNQFHKTVMKDAYRIDVEFEMNLLDCITFEEDRLKSKRNYDKALAGISHITIEQYGEFKNCYYETRYNPIINEANEVIGATCFAVDITERINSNRALAENEHKYRELVENSPDAIVIYLDSKIVFGNKQALILIGATSTNQLIGRSVLEFVHPSSHSVIIERMRNSSKEVLPTAEEKFVKIDGTKVDVEIKATKIKINNKEAVQLIVRDITERKLAENAILESEANYRFMFENNPHPMFIYDLETLDFLEVNLSAVTHYGYSKVEFLSMTLKDIRPQEDLPGLMKDLEIENENNHTTTHWRHITKSKDVIYVEVTAHTIKYKGKKARHILVNDITELKRVEHTLMKRQEELKCFAANLQNVREEERMLLAREIHDELAQILIAVKIDMGIMKKKLSKDINTITVEGFLNNFNSIFSMVDNTIHSSRKIMSGLKSEVLELLGFIETVKLYSKEFEERQNIKCVLNLKEDKIELDSFKSIALFRIYQDILNNVALHAEATEVIVFLGIKNNMLVFEITDNGKGFDDKKPMNGDAHGIKSMKERVYILDGKLVIDALPDKGTRVNVEIPYVKG